MRPSQSVFGVADLARVHCQFARSAKRSETEYIDQTVSRVVVVMIRAVRRTGRKPWPKQCILSFVYRELGGRETIVLVRIQGDRQSGNGPRAKHKRIFSAVTPPSINRCRKFQQTI